MTVQTDRGGGGFITDSTIGDTTSVVSVQSSVSTRSSRSGLTRQGNRKRNPGIILHMTMHVDKKKMD